MKRRARQFLDDEESADNAFHDDVIDTFHHTTTQPLAQSLCRQLHSRCCAPLTFLLHVARARCRATQRSSACDDRKTFGQRHNMHHECTSKRRGCFRVTPLSPSILAAFVVVYFILLLLVVFCVIEYFVVLEAVSTFPLLMEGNNSHHIGQAHMQKTHNSAVPRDVRKLLHQLFVKVFACFGVDLVAHERELADYWRERHWNNLRDGRGRSDGGQYRDQGPVPQVNPAACVGVRVGRVRNAELESDGCASQWNPLEAPAQLSASSLHRDASTHTLDGRRARLAGLLEDDSTVLMLFHPLRTSSNSRATEQIRQNESTRVWNASTCNGGSPTQAAYDIILHDTADTDGEETADAGVPNAHDEDESCDSPFDFTRRTVERTFRDVAAVFVADRHIGPCDATANQNAACPAESPFFSFFAQQQATLWQTYTDPAQQRNNARTQSATPSIPVVRARPLRIDVVFTYVNPASPSFAAAQQVRRQQQQQQQQQPHDGHTFEFEHAAEGQRMRDWGELRYALRSVDRFLLHSPALQHHARQLLADVPLLKSELGIEVEESVAQKLAQLVSRDENGEEGALSLIGDVYLVVADVDQVPQWMRRDTHTYKRHALHVITHQELLQACVKASSDKTAHPPRSQAPFARLNISQQCLFFANQTLGSVHGEVLPTFNSRVIESLLHHIPGLSRFYLYANNDNLFGQPLSLFDLLRPLAPPRQEQRLAAYRALPSGKVEERTTRDGMSSGDRGGCPRQKKRSALFLEPILRREALEDLWQPSVSASVEAQSARVLKGDAAGPLSENVPAASAEAASRDEAAVRAQLRALRHAGLHALQRCSHPSLPEVRKTEGSMRNGVLRSLAGAFDRCVAAASERLFHVATANSPSHHERCNVTSVQGKEGERFGGRRPISPTLAGFSTRTLFRMPSWAVEDAHGRQQWSIALEYFDGLTPALIHPHAVVLLDKQWMTTLLEETLAEETAIMRLHSVRQTFGEFIPVSAFVLYAVALRRQRDRQLWAMAVRGLESSNDRRDGGNDDVGDVASAVLPGTLLQPYFSPTLRHVAAQLAQPLAAKGDPLQHRNDKDAHKGEAALGGVRDDEAVVVQVRTDEQRLLQLRRAVASEQLDLCRTTPDTNAQAPPLRMDELGPLFGDLHGVHSQHPFLFDHLASWWVDAALWQHGNSAVEKPGASLNTTDVPVVFPTSVRSPFDGNVCAMYPLRRAPRLRGDLLRFPIVLRKALPLPTIELRQQHAVCDALKAEGTASRNSTTPEPQVMGRTTRHVNRFAHPQRTRQWKTLFLDVDYHWRDGWPNEEVDDERPFISPHNGGAKGEKMVPPAKMPTQASAFTTDMLLLVPLKDHEQVTHVMEQFAVNAAARPVQATFNDELSFDGPGVHNRAAVQAMNATLAKLFDTYVDHAPKSRWEN